MFDFEKFHNIGEELSKTDDEAHIRSALNRDYYSLFRESRKYLVEVRKKKYLKSKKGIHTKVCNALRNSKDPTENYIGDILNYLRNVRGFADYDWDKKRQILLQKYIKPIPERRIRRIRIVGIFE